MECHSQSANTYLALWTQQGVLVITFVSSLGFHYYQTVAQSLQLQWLEKERAPQVLGWIVSAGALGALISYAAIIGLWELFYLDYRTVYWASGSVSMIIALYCWFAFPNFRPDTVQNKKIVLKKRYWLYYALVFMGGARRQIFVVFAAFMMVELYGFELHHIAGLMLINHLTTMIASPLVGKMISKMGERFSLIVEYIGLLTVFLLYAGVSIGLSGHGKLQRYFMSSTTYYLRWHLRRKRISKRSQVLRIRLLLRLSHSQSITLPQSSCQPRLAICGWLIHRQFTVHP